MTRNTLPLRLPAVRSLRSLCALALCLGAVSGCVDSGDENMDDTGAVADTGEEVSASLAACGVTGGVRPPSGAFPNPIDLVIDYDYPGVQCRDGVWTVSGQVNDFWGSVEQADSTQVQIWDIQSGALVGEHDMTSDNGVDWTVSLSEEEVGASCDALTRIFTMSPKNADGTGRMDGFGYEESPDFRTNVELSVHGSEVVLMLEPLDGVSLDAAWAYWVYPFEGTAVGPIEPVGAESGRYTFSSSLQQESLPYTDGAGVHIIWGLCKDGEVVGVGAY